VKVAKNRIMQMVGAKSVAQDEIHETFKIEIFQIKPAFYVKKRPFLPNLLFLEIKSAKFG
jgi:hypothetical protein